jgi:hypothetical protein
MSKQIQVRLCQAEEDDAHPLGKFSENICTRCGESIGFGRELFHLDLCDDCAGANDEGDDD